MVEVLIMNKNLLVLTLTFTLCAGLINNPAYAFWGVFGKIFATQGAKKAVKRGVILSSGAKVAATIGGLVMTTATLHAMEKAIKYGESFVDIKVCKELVETEDGEIVIPIIYPSKYRFCPMDKTTPTRMSIRLTPSAYEAIKFGEGLEYALICLGRNSMDVYPQHYTGCPNNEESITADFSMLYLN